MAQDIRSNYPFATRDNQAIPADILKPSRFFQCTAGSSVLFLSTEEVCLVEASGGPALLAFASSAPAVVNATAIPDAMYLPWGVPVLVAIPHDKSSRAFIVALTGEVTTVRIQTIESWKSVDNQSAFRNRF